MSCRPQSFPAMGHLAMFKVLIIPLVVVGVCAAVANVDLFVQARGFFAELPPDYSPYFMARTALALLFGTGIAFWIASGREQVVLLGGVVTSLAACAAFVFLAVSVYVMVTDPLQFNLLTVEDGLFEWLSVFALVAAGIMAIAAALVASLAARKFGLQGLLLVGLAIVFFAIAIEEVSWLQRIFGFATPAWFKTWNGQGESNLHNVATSLFENAYYFGAFILLVYVPFVYSSSRILRQDPALSALVPGCSVMGAGALTTTFSYQMWNIFWMQTAFFFTLAALIIMASRLWQARAPIAASLLFFAALLLFMVHTLVLYAGPSLVRNWADKELKELVVAFGLFLMAVEILLRAFGEAGQQPPVTSPGSGPPSAQRTQTRLQM